MEMLSTNIFKHIGPHVLVLTETQVSDTREEEEFFFNGYSLETRFRIHRGLCVYIKNSIAYSRAKQFEISTDTAQTIVLKLSFNKGPIIFLISIYRSPSEHAHSQFFEILTQKLDEIRSKIPDSELVVVGDFNVHHKVWLKSSKTDEVGEQACIFASSHDLTEIVQQPTFLPSNDSHSQNQLDLCLTSIPLS